MNALAPFAETDAGFLAADPAPTTRDRRSRGSGARLRRTWQRLADLLARGQLGPDPEQTIGRTTAARI